MKVSLIATVRNEAESITRLLDSISAQTRRPDEVVIADGGSIDATVPLIEAWGARQPFPVRVVVVPGANIAQGRNAAIRAAQHDIIASTDAGVRLDARWLARLLKRFQAAGEQGGKGAEVTISSAPPLPRSPAPLLPSPPAVVSGFFVADPRTVFEMAMSATVLPTLAEIKSEAFLPSSRSVAFTKAAWGAVGGYPEWLDYCEDLVFDFALRRNLAFAFAPDAIAHFRPRSSLRAFFRQYYLYARGDGKADLWRKRHAMRYATYLVATPLLIMLSVLHSPWWLLALGPGAFIYCRTPYRRLLAYWPRMNVVEKSYAIALVPIIRVVGDVAKMVGYPAGVWWRISKQVDR